MASNFSDIAARAQAFLFVEGGSLTIKRLSQLLKVDNGKTEAALKELATHIEGSGLALVLTATEAAVVTAPKVSEMIKQTFEEQLNRDIGEAGLEVLSAVLYRGPSTRAEIDYIRGVNTVSTIRTLLARGLLERSIDEHIGREYRYKPTAELLAHLGITAVNELPDYATIRAELLAFEHQGETSGAHHDRASQHEGFDGQS